MSAAAEPVLRGGGLPTAALLGFAMGVLGLLGGLTIYVGPALGVGAVAAATVLRRVRPRWLGRLNLLVPLVALAVLAATAPPAPSTELFGALGALGLLLWVADDPERPRGGGRRALPILSVAALGVGLAWGVTLAFPSRSPDVALGGALLATALVLLAVLLGGLPRVSVAPFRNA